MSRHEQAMSAGNGEVSGGAKACGRKRNAARFLRYGFQAICPGD